MNNEKIKTYDELNVDEKEVIDTFRKMKLLSDQSRFELFQYRLTDLLNRYEDLLELCKETEALLFDILEEIDKNELSQMQIIKDQEGTGRLKQITLMKKQIQFKNINLVLMKLWI